MLFRGKRCWIGSCHVGMMRQVRHLHSCYDLAPDGVSVGAFRPHPGHDAHLHPTLSAIQILATHDAMDLLDVDDRRERITQCQLLTHAVQ